MSRLLHFGDVIAVNASLFPDKIGARDLARSLTFRAWNERSCRLANTLRGLGLEQGDRIAIFAHNCLEWMEIYAAIAKAALVLVPINFRLVGSEIGYIIENSEAIIVQHRLIDPLHTVRDGRLISDHMYIHFGGPAPWGIDHTRT
jgi:fatty-acyl-CoA synthase